MMLASSIKTKRKRRHSKRKKLVTEKRNKTYGRRGNINIKNGEHTKA
jgi:hypothetical protein